MQENVVFVLTFLVPKAAELVLKLCFEENADVFIENYRTDAILVNMVLGYEDVKSVNPKIVYASLTAFGQNGPLGHRPGFDDVVQARFRFHGGQSQRVWSYSNGWTNSGFR